MQTRQLTRTTVRLDPVLKKDLEFMAVENNITFQEIFQNAVREYVYKKAGKKAKHKIRFYSQNMGVALDNLTRDDYYDD